MIMVLSCCDLVTILIGIQRFMLRFACFMTENDNLLPKIEVYQRFVTLSSSVSMLAMLLMSIERYLGVYIPIFHRRSVTRRRLLASLAISTIMPAILLLMSVNQTVISYPDATGIFSLVYIGPFVFFNYKLFKMSRKVRRTNVAPAETRTKIKGLRNVSSCLLVVACFLFFSTPGFAYIVVSSIEGSSSKNAQWLFLWAATIFRMNFAFNSLIFFWKNKVLRTEGIKVLQAMKTRVFGTETNTIASFGENTHFAAKILKQQTI